MEKENPVSKAQIQFSICQILHLPSPNTKQLPSQSKTEGSQDEHTVWYQHNAALSAAFETGPDHGDDHGTTTEVHSDDSFFSLK